MEVNIVNKNVVTPLDTLFLFQREAGDKEIEKILRQLPGLSKTTLISKLIHKTKLEIEKLGRF